ncbi:10343_t:CDS:2, partial [Gigaspora rosea]
GGILKNYFRKSILFRKSTEDLVKNDYFWWIFGLVAFLGEKHATDVTCIITQEYVPDRRSALRSSKTQPLGCFIFGYTF